MKNVILTATLLVVFLSLGCSRGETELTSTQKAHVHERVSALAEQVAQDLANHGPIGWLDHFLQGPEFYMASDGVLLFPDFDSAAVFVDMFAPSIASMELVWKDVRIDPLESDMATIAASYDEVLRDTSGTVLDLTGYFTGLAVETSEGWKFRHMHWSSPSVTESGD